MTKRVLVGTDGSLEAQVALRWATRFCVAIEGELTVTSAWRPTATMTPDERDKWLADAHSILEEEWCAPAREAGLAYDALLVEGDPRDWLLVHGDEVGADLIVVGSGGAGGSHPLHLGSVPHYLIHHADRPTAVIPPQTRPNPPARIVVGVDGSAGSARAVQWCVDYGAALDANVFAVYAERPLAEWVPRDDPRSWYHQAQQDCEAWAAPLRGTVPTHIRVMESEPVHGLTEVGIREEADAFVVGSRGRGGFTGLRLGSTALRLLQRSGLPVVLVPPPRN